MYKHSCVMADWFTTTNDVFKNIPDNPDIIFLAKDRREELLMEVGWVFDLYMDIAFYDKITKYQPISTRIRDLCYECKLIVSIFGSLGQVHKLTVSGLGLAGLSKTRGKKLAKFCSISATIGSLAVWHR